MKIKKHYYCLVDNNNKPDFRFIFTNKHDAEKKRQQIKNSLTGETLFVSKNKRDFFIDGIKKDFIDKTKQINIKKGCWTTLKTTKISLLDTVKPEAYFKEIIQSSQKISSSQPVIEFENTPSKAPESITQPVEKKISLVTPQKQSSLLKQKITSSEKEFSSTYFPKKYSKASQSQPANSTSQMAKSKKTTTRFLLSKKIFNISNFKSLPNLKIPRNYSILKTRLFVVNFAIVLLICFGIIFNVTTTSNKKISTALSEAQQRLVSSQSLVPEKIAVLGSMDKKNNDDKSDVDNSAIDTMVFNTLIEFEKIRSDQLEESIKKMVAGTPMEKMAPYIAKKDKIVAAFLVGISKKESNYGRRVPVLNGEDCFNYWGYRGIRKRMGSGGHTCFDSPEDAIETVGGRIERLVKSGVDTPEEMVLWKCGSDCNATGGWPAARKWIKDVNMYYTKMLDTANGDEQSSEKIRVLNKTTQS
jgi:hypothetical protein